MFKSLLYVVCLVSDRNGGAFVGFIYYDVIVGCEFLEC